MRLTQALPGMIARGRGAIINVASLMAFDDRPGWTPYLAAKAFVTRFTENLAVEPGGSGVTLQVLCPGPERGTQFCDRAGFDSTVFPAEVTMDPDDVVEAPLAALARDKLLCVPGLEDPTPIEEHDRHRDRMSAQPSRPSRRSVVRPGRRRGYARWPQLLIYDPYRQPPGPPGPRGTVEHPGQGRITVRAPAVAGQTPGAQPVPVALDQQRAALVAAGALALRIVHVAGVGVAQAVIQGDAPGPGQRRRGRAAGRAS